VISERELGGDLRDRKPGRLGRERRRSRHAGVHFDDDDSPVFGIDGELDVRSARLDADPPDDPAAEIAHPLVFLVCQRQGGRDGDAVARVHAHRVDVLDRADDDKVVGAVAHHLELELFPADHRFLEEHFVNGAEIDAAAGKLAEFLDVVGDAAADATQGKRRTDDDRKAERVDCRECFLHVPHVAAFRHVGADFLHRVAELQAVFGERDRLDRGANQLDAVLLQRAQLRQRNREVQRGLAADGRQHGIRALALDDFLEHVRRQRLDVGPIRNLRIGHDRRRIAVDEDDFEPFGAERFARLGSRIVELAGLSDHNRPRANHEHTFDVSPLGHYARFSISSRN